MRERITQGVRQGHVDRLAYLADLSTDKIGDLKKDFPTLKKMRYLIKDFQLTI